MSSQFSYVLDMSHVITTISLLLRFSCSAFALDLESVLKVIDDIETTQCIHVYLNNGQHCDRTSSFDWKRSFESMKSLYHFSNDGLSNSKSHEYTYMDG